MASASSSVSGLVVPPSMPGIPTVCALPGWTAMMLVPNCVNWSIMNWRVPSPIEVRSTTEPTPIAMPSVERNERSLWARTAESARARRSVIRVTPS